MWGEFLTGSPKEIIVYNDKDVDTGPTGIDFDKDGNVYISRLRVSPALEAGITDHTWTLRELLSTQV